MELRGELLATTEALAPHLDAWDALAVAAGRPYSAPAWALAWWRHAASQGALLRVAAAFDGDRLAGIAPLFVDPGETGDATRRMLGGRSAARIEPVAVDGREAEAGAAFREALATASSRSIDLAMVPAASPWPELLAGGASIERRRTVPAPFVSIQGGDFDSWLAGKSGNFRQQFRRTRRRLDDLGARFRMTGTADELERDLASFARLHHARWQPRGGSSALTPERERMLADACRELLASERARLWSLEVDGRTISSHLFMAAGGEVAYWLGGFDDAFAEHRPALQVLVAAIEDGFRRGERRVDLGPGGQDYKYRLADGEETLEDVTIAPEAVDSPAS